MSPLSLLLAIFYAGELGPNFFPDVPWWVWALTPMVPLLFPAGLILHLVGVRITVPTGGDA